MSSVRSCELPLTFRLTRVKCGVEVTAAPLASASAILGVPLQRRCQGYGLIQGSCAGIAPVQTAGEPEVDCRRNLS